MTDKTKCPICGVSTGTRNYETRHKGSKICEKRRMN